MIKKEEFINEERGKRRDTTKRDLKKRLERTLQALNTKPLPRNAEQLFKNYADLFFDRTMPKGGFGRKRNMGDLNNLLFGISFHSSVCSPQSIACESQNTLILIYIKVVLVILIVQI